MVDVVGILAAFFLLCLNIRLLNISLFPVMAVIAPVVRDVSTGCGVLVGIGIVLIALRQPSLLGKKFITPLAAVLGAAGMIMAGIGATIVNAPLVTIGFTVSSAGTTWVGLLVMDALCDLSFRQLAVGLPLCVGAANLCGWLLSDTFLQGASFGIAIVISTLYALFAVVLIRKSISSTLKLAVNTEPLDSAALLRPASYLPLKSSLYVCIFAMSVVGGFSQRFTSIEGSTWGLPIAGCMLLILALWNTTARGTRRYDTIFSLVVVAMMAGFLTALLPSYERVASVLFGISGGLSTALFDLVMASVAARNRRASLLVFAWGGVMSTLGAIVGANVGAATQSAVFGDTAQLVVVVVAVALLAYVELGMRDFSFAKTIEGVTADETPAISDHIAADVSADDKVTGAGRPAEDMFVQACAQVAEVHGLTPRETDVLRLLARGRNGAFIQEELTISHNTVKSYIKHVYAKLNIHSQQELIDIVEAKMMETRGGA